MIIYLASYPRSGNSWLRNLIGLNWGYLTANGYMEDWERFKKTCSSKYELKDEQMPDSEGSLQSVFPANLFAFYLDPYGGERRLYLKPGCLHWLDEKTRKILANDTNTFFVKTHERPYQTYYEGEKVLQIVRDPLATIWSYYIFHKNYKKHARSITDIILGDVKFGSWSNYHKEWAQASLRPDITYRFIRYEDLHQKELVVATEIGSFLNFDKSPSAQYFFDQCHERDPKRYPTGKKDNYLSNLSPEHIQMIWLLHSDVAEIYGYKIKVDDDNDIAQSIGEAKIRDSSRNMIAEAMRSISKENGDLKTQVEELSTKVEKLSTIRGGIKHVANKIIGKITGDSNR
jgi:hypothetical protein